MSGLGSGTDTTISSAASTMALPQTVSDEGNVEIEGRETEGNLEQLIEVTLQKAGRSALEFSVESYRKVLQSEAGRQLLQSIDEELRGGSLSVVDRHV